MAKWEEPLSPTHAPLGGRCKQSVTQQPWPGSRPPSHVTLLHPHHPLHLLHPLQRQVQLMDPNREEERKCSKKAKKEERRQKRQKTNRRKEKSSQKKERGQKRKEGKRWQKGTINTTMTSRH